MAVGQNSRLILEQAFMGMPTKGYNVHAAMLNERRGTAEDIPAGLKPGETFTGRRGFPPVPGRA